MDASQIQNHVKIIREPNLNVINSKDMILLHHKELDVGQLIH